MPGGLERHGDGWALSVRVRLVHAQIRYLLNNSPGEWDLEAWGEPISAAHVGYAAAAFSARLLKHMKSLGADFNEEERKSFMDIWRYTGYLMGVPESILFKDEEEALRLFEIAKICEPAAGRLFHSDGECLNQFRAYGNRSGEHFRPPSAGKVCL